MSKIKLTRAERLVIKEKLILELGKYVNQCVSPAKLANSVGFSEETGVSQVLKLIREITEDGEPHPFIFGYDEGVILVEGVEKLEEIEHVLSGRITAYKKALVRVQQARSSSTVSK